MSIEAMVNVWKYSKHNGSRLLMLLAIADFENDRGLSWPSIETLAKKTRMSDVYTRQVVHELCESGELELVELGGGRRSNSYRITLAPIAGNTPIAGHSAGDNRGIVQGITGDERNPNIIPIEPSFSDQEENTIDTSNIVDTTKTESSLSTGGNLGIEPLIPATVVGQLDQPAKPPKPVIVPRTPGAEALFALLNQVKAAQGHRLIKGFQNPVQRDDFEAQEKRLGLDSLNRAIHFYLQKNITALGDIVSRLKNWDTTATRLKERIPAPAQDGHDQAYHYEPFSWMSKFMLSPGDPGYDEAKAAALAAKRRANDGYDG